MDDYEVFTKDSCYIFYRNDTLGISSYCISDSCKSGYEGLGSTPVAKSYLLEHYYDYPYKVNDTGYYSCSPITELNNSELVIMNFDGSISHFHRIR